jgi:hypothetical protein
VVRGLGFVDPAVVSWHHRHDSDPAHQWLRGVVTEVVSIRLGLTAPPPP